MNFNVDNNNFNLSKHGLEYFLIFCICVAGKTASQIEKALTNFITMIPCDGDPIDKLAYLISNNILEQYIQISSLGQHKKLARAFRDLVEKRLNLKDCTLKDLLEIHGIGPKTARYFLVYTRPNQEFAILDTHILKYLNTLNLNIVVPKTTPIGKKYEELEKIFLDHAKKMNKTCQELDLEIWLKYSRYGRKDDNTKKYAKN